MESQKINELQNEINLITLELNQTQEPGQRNKLMKKLQIKNQEKELQRLKDLMK